MNQPGLFDEYDPPDGYTAPVLHPAEAYAFYERFILRPVAEKQEFFRRYGFAWQRTVGSMEWEVFAAVLLDDRAAAGGSDLRRTEVKSAHAGGSFEYQYCRVGGVAKLRHEAKIDHLFVAHRDGCLDVDVRLMRGVRMRNLLAAWEPEVVAYYAADAKRQRFRKSVTWQYVTDRSDRVLTVRGGDLTYPILKVPPCARTSTC